MKISIITVCYNNISTIKNTLDSILNQMYQDIEYIVIDGNSTDDTVSIIKEYEKKFNFRLRWISEPDNGIYDAMNKGIKMAKGEVIGILNADDFYASEKVLENVYNTIYKYNVDSCYGNLLYIKNKRPYRYWIAGDQKSFKYGWMPPHPCFFVKRSVYEKYGYFRLDCGTAADYELMLRFLEKEKISTKWINKLFVNMSIGGISNNSISSRLKAMVNDKKGWNDNNLKPYFFTLFLKKLLKTPQYFQALKV